MKFACVSGVVRWSGGTTVLNRGQAADDDHPLVLERPDLFGDVSPVQVSLPAPGPTRRVERATQGPGEVRTPVSAPAGTLTDDQRMARPCAVCGQPLNSLDLRRTRHAECAA